MAVKRKINTSAAASTSALPAAAAKQPLLKQVAAANSSKTRDHLASYHRIVDKFDVAKDINAPLLAWYGNRGSLPWRKDLSDEELSRLSDKDKAQRAYEVWVSEIMLQQTQVATVIPYYGRWIEAFPTVQALAKADIEEVNAIWKGLGYYSRASRLLEGAKTVVKSFQGRLPSEPDVLVKQIEGIGPYTAGAIASIAHGVKAATVDGNIQRVICRLLAIHADMKKKATLDYIWEVAEDLVPDKRAGHWNQALMDLGATVCTPKNPKCTECPFNQVCLAYAEQCTAHKAAKSVDMEDIVKGTTCKLCISLDPPSLERDVTLYPLKVVKKKSRDEDIAVCVVEWVSSAANVEQDSMILLVKRPKTGLLAGLDEFPSVVMPDDDSSPTGRLAQSLELLNELLVLPSSFVLKPIRDYTALSVTGTTDLGSIKHIYSHINATFHCRHLKLSSEKPPRIQAEKGRCRWVEKSAIASANISTGAVKIWDLANGKAAKGKPKKKTVKGESVKVDIKQFLTKRPSSSQEKTPDSSTEQQDDTPRKKRKLVIIESDSE